MDRKFTPLALPLCLALVVFVGGCSLGKKDSDAKKTKGLSTVANTGYRSPSYAWPNQLNPNLNLPSNFSQQSISVTQSRGLTDQPYIAMTFDDGPHPTNTPRLLDILRQRNIKATFYVIGQNVQRYPEITRRIVAEGHEIGNHTWSHTKLTTLGDSSVQEELRRTQDAIVAATGVKPRTMRPPYGALLTRQREMVFNEFGYPTVLWSVDPEDWRRPGVDVVCSRILGGASNGAIILAHDLHAPTVDAMPQTLDRLLERGYRFITVSQMLTQKAVVAQ
jgi:peptidoglycan/xylan/chitin deacetylase (PgdA/CDA1 family)